MDRQLSILFITSDKYPPFRPAARVIFGEELSRRGHRIDWLLQAERCCMHAYEVPYGNGSAYIAATNDGTSRVNRLRKHLLDLINDLSMFRLLWQHRYDLIQVKDKYIAALFAIVAAKIFKARFFYWLAYPHAEASLYQVTEGIARYKLFYILRGNFFKFVLYKVILPFSDHIFVQSEQMKKDIAAEGIPLEKMTAIPGSLSLNELPSMDLDMDLSLHDKNKDKRVIYLGTLMRARKLDFIIRAHSIVMKKHPNAKLLLIGKGEMPEDEQYLLDEANRLGINDSVVFVGHVALNYAWELIKSADVCISPYYPTPILNSTSPTKLIEYMAMGKAVVGNNHPEQSLVIAESGAGICVPWDENEFAGAITTLLENPALANEMGKRGRRYVELYRTNAVMAEKIEREYLRVCN